MNRIRKTCRKENGSTLVVVLLVMAVFSVMGLMLIGVTLAHSQQIGQSTAKIQATNAAEMGLKAYDTKIEQVIGSINKNIGQTSNFDTFRNALDRELPNVLNSDQSLSLSLMQNSPKFRVTVENETAANDKVTFTLKSTGTVNENERVITQLKTFDYNDNSANQPICDPDGYMDVKFPCLDGILYYNGAFTKNGNVLVNGEKENKKINFNLSNNDIPNAVELRGSQVISNTAFDSNVIIRGSTIVEGNVTFKGNVYITGSISIIGNATFQGFVYFKGSHSLTPASGGTIPFKRLVFADGSLSAYSSNALIEFDGGLVSGGSTSLSTDPSGKIIIGGMRQISLPETSETKYQ